MTGRMVETAKNYLEGPRGVKGNLSASMREAGYSLSYANTHCDTFATNGEFKKALTEQKAILEQRDEESRINIDKRFNERYNACVKRDDNTNAIRCIENMAKNRGYYAADNAQRTEQVKLDKAETEEAQRIARILNLEDARKSLSQATG